MKNTVIGIMFALALGFAVAPTFAQTAQFDHHDASQNQVSQSEDVITANQSQEQVSKWTEPTSNTVTVVSTPLEPKSRHRQHSDDSSDNRPSKEDWAGCIQNERCLPRSLFNNQWDRAFGPAYVFGN